MSASSRKRETKLTRKSRREAGSSKREIIGSSSRGSGANGQRQDVDEQLLVLGNDREGVAGSGPPPSGLKRVIGRGVGKNLNVVALKHAPEDVTGATRGAFRGDQHEALGQTTVKHLTDLARFVDRAVRGRRQHHNLVAGNPHPPHNTPPP